eukprot:gene14130-biopygen11297
MSARKCVLYLLVLHCVAVSKGNWYYHNSGFFASQTSNDADNSADKNSNVLNEEVFTCNINKSCSGLSKVTETNTLETWNKVQGPLYVIPNNDGVAILKNWLQARQYCLDLKGDLLSTGDWAENQAVVNFVQSTNLAGDMWIGMNDRRQEGTMEWSDGSPVTFTNWNEDEPNNTGGNEDCVSMYLNKDGFPWNDAPCQGYTKQFICEIHSN